MSPRFISAAELRAALTFIDLIEPVAEAFRLHSAGRAENGMIVTWPLDDKARGDVYVKSGVLKGHSHYIVKVSPWSAHTAEHGLPQGGVVMVFDAVTGSTTAILDDQHYLSDIRTAAAGALAARYLAPQKVTTATVLGAGVQAWLQPQALFHERRFDRLLIWARDPAKAEALRQRLAPVLPDVTIEVASDREAAVRACDVLMTCTQSTEPLVKGDWLHPGQHITAVGADDVSKCELDADVLNRARVFVDDRAITLAHGDVHRAVASGRYTEAQIAGEIGQLIAGGVGGRQAGDITVAKFVGIGAQDVAAAETALARISA